MAFVIDKSGAELIAGKLDELINSVDDEYTQKSLVEVLDSISSDLFMMNVLKIIELHYKDENMSFDDLYNDAKEFYLLYRNLICPDIRTIKTEDAINGKY